MKTLRIFLRLSVVMAYTLLVAITWSRFLSTQSITGLAILLGAIVVGSYVLIQLNAKIDKIGCRTFSCGECGAKETTNYYSLRTWIKGMREFRDWPITVCSKCGAAYVNIEYWDPTRLATQAHVRKCRDMMKRFGITV